MKKFTTKISHSLFLMRHGKIDYNDRFENGGYVEVHGQLSKAGIDQVAASAQEIQLILTNRDVTVITSPKRRCFQSADVIINVLEKDHTINVLVDAGFRDVDILTRCQQRLEGSYAVWEAK